MPELTIKSQQEVIDSLPVHLRPFVATQDYLSYTPRDQAVWRFLMYQLVDNLKDTAHPLYIEGLKRTGIDVESIPKIEVMNAHLEKIGWRAAVVDGFIPPAIFIEFLAHRVLVVAVDIRSIEHMLYTPAPDIIHESAGHAPFIIDVDYAEYLERVGKFGRRVITHKSDIEIYEAIRHLSIVKESPTATNEELEQAERTLEQTIEKYKHEAPSESNLLSRLQWWTTEYGLVGTTDSYKIYGAGLLSSLGESVNCLDDGKVKKRLLTIDAVGETYDITHEQPQLFVARSCRHLSQIADEFARSMCYFTGGTKSLEVAIKAETVNTAVYNSGLEVSGVISKVHTDALGNTIYLHTQGPTQLAFGEKEIDQQGCDHHAQGFGSPVGKLQEMDRCLSSYTIDDLIRFGIKEGKHVTLSYLSGIEVRGELKAIYRREGRNLLFTFEDCTVIDINGETLFAPSWGTYDMAVGDAIVSVYGGSADPEKYPLYSKPQDSANLPVEHDQSTLLVFEVYASARKLRQALSGDEAIDDRQYKAEVLGLVEQYIERKLNEWLLAFELCELAIEVDGPNETYNRLKRHIQDLQNVSEGQSVQLITYALNRLSSMEEQA